MRFRAVLALHGKTATGISVPAEVVEALGGKRVAVSVTLNGGYTYRSTVAPMRGEYLLPVSAENRTGAGLTAGDEVEVDLEPDTAPREVEVPADLAAALAAAPDAKAFFDGLSNSNKRAYTSWVESAKKADTRERRVAEAVALLASGRTR